MADIKELARVFIVCYLIVWIIGTGFMLIFGLAILPISGASPPFYVMWQITVWITKWAAVGSLVMVLMRIYLDGRSAMRSKNNAARNA